MNLSHWDYYSILLIFRWFFPLLLCSVVVAVATAVASFVFFCCCYCVVCFISASHHFDHNSVSFVFHLNSYASAVRGSRATQTNWEKNKQIKFTKFEWKIIDIDLICTPTMMNFNVFIVICLGGGGFSTYHTLKGPIC